MHTRHATPAADDLAFVNGWQRQFPLCETPFATLAQAQGCSQEQVLAMCRRLQANGLLGRIGAVFAPGAGGASTLAAMAVLPERLEAVAAIVSAHPGVNHNYERESAINLWFVMTGPDATTMEADLQGLETATGLPVLRLPMVRPYRIDLAFNLESPQIAAGGRTRTAQAPVAPQETGLAALAEQGLPLQPRPFDAWAQVLGWETPRVLSTLQRWLDQGTLSRFGMVVRHHEAGYTANAMTVFDVPDAIVDALGDVLAHQSGVTLAYRRARAPGWPYNLYCMVHGQERTQVLALIRQAMDRCALAGYPHQVLFSLRRFTQRGARRFSAHTACSTPPEAAHV